MRVLINSWEYPPAVVGGLGKHVTELVAALGQITLDDGPLFVDVLTPRFAGGEQVEQINSAVTVCRVDMPLIQGNLYDRVLAYNASLLEYINNLRKPYKYDLIHTHDLMGAVGIALKHQGHLPLVATIHATARGRYQRSPSSYINQFDQLERDVCHEAEQVIVCSHFIRQEIHSYWNTPYDKINVIANGVSIRAGENCSAEELEVLRQQYAPMGQKLLLFVGAITNEKGILVLIRAMPSILTEYPNTRLLLVGGYTDKLGRLAYELNVDKAIEFLGYISDRQRDCLYQLVDATIIPSLYEPFGIVALEAMALGCNVIASDVGGLSEVVKHRKNGLLIQPNDPQSIVSAVSQLFANPLAAREWRMNALNEIDTLYRWEKIAAQTVQLYQLIVSTHK